MAGLGDGLLCPNYVQDMTSNFCVIQPIMSSSYNRFGTSSLSKDAEELLEVIMCVRESLADIRQVVLMGLSTGCQSICTLLTSFKDKLDPHFIKGIVLQGAVSDRQYFLDELNPNHVLYQQILEEAEGNKDAPNKLLTLPFMNAPINVYRARSRSLRTVMMITFRWRVRHVWIEW